MAHPAQRRFCEEVRERFPEAFRDVRVLEVGSRNVNGTPRGLFDAAEYVGIDCTAGDGVDVVQLGHEYAAEPGTFDTVLTLETLEHDPHAERTVAHLVKLLRPGGLFLMTCAGEGRREHGTARTGRRYGPDPGFYRNVRVADLLAWLRPGEVSFRELYVQHDAASCDLYCYAIKG